MVDPTPSLHDPWIGRSLPLPNGFVTLRKRIARGGFSSVYQATSRQHPAAVKILAPPYQGLSPFQQRLRREAELLERLAGRGAPRLFGVGEFDGALFLAMELLSGLPLPTGPLALPEVARLGRALLDAVAPIHRCGIVHRDLKPANLIRVGDTIRLLDFGAACEVGVSADTAAPLALNTPAYSAPEQSVNTPPDPRDDLYSVAIILFELAAGRRPYLGDPVALLEAHAAAPVPSIRTLVPALPAAFDALLLRALDKSPRGRFADAEQMRAALQRFL